MAGSRYPVRKSWGVRIEEEVCIGKMWPCLMFLKLILRGAFFSPGLAKPLTSETKTIKECFSSSQSFY